jgi:hypothetical protein
MAEASLSSFCRQLVWFEAALSEESVAALVGSKHLRTMVVFQRFGMDVVAAVSQLYRRRSMPLFPVLEGKIKWPVGSEKI